MPKATDILTTPAYRLGTHPRRTDHPALLTNDGALALTFAIDASRAEIAAKLQAGGLTLHADDTVTQAPPVPTRRRLLSGFTGAAAAASMLAIAMPSNAPAAENPDAKLIAMCDEYVRLEADYARVCWADGDYVDTPECNAALAEFKAVNVRRSALEDLIVNADARTVAGLRARARAAAAYYGGDFNPRGAADSFMWASVCDLLDGDVV